MMRDEIKGSLQLLLLNPKSIDFFNPSKAAALRSLWTFVMVIPLGLATLGYNHLPYLAHYQVSLAVLLLCKLIAFVLAYSLGLWLVWQISKWESADAHFPRFVTVTNWFALVSGLLFLPAFFLDQSGLLSHHQRMSFGTALYILFLAYNWFIAWRVFKVNPFMAAGISITLPMIDGVFSDFVNLKLYGVARPFEEQWFIDLSNALP